MLNTPQHQATILKGVASQIIQMSVPTYKEVNLLLEPFSLKIEAVKEDCKSVTMSNIVKEAAYLLDTYLDYVNSNNGSDAAFRIACYLFKGLGFQNPGAKKYKASYSPTKLTYTIQEL